MKQIIVKIKYEDRGKNPWLSNWLDPMNILLMLKHAFNNVYFKVTEIKMKNYRRIK